MARRRWEVAAVAGIAAVVGFGLTSGRAQDGAMPPATVEQRLQRIEETLTTLVTEVRAVSAKVDRLARAEGGRGDASDGRGAVEAAGAALRARIDQVKRVKAQVLLKNIRVALEMYCVDAGAYPSGGQGLAALWQKPAGAEHWGGPYLQLEQGASQPVDPWGNAPRYRWPSPDGRSPELWSAGPDGQDGTADDVRAD